MDKDQPALLTNSLPARIAVDEATYLKVYAEQFYEWVDGVAIKMSPAGLKHNRLMIYLVNLLNAFFEVRPLGQCLTSPFILYLPSIKNYREPDLMVLLNGNVNELTETSMNGAPDICIEVVSEESVARDYADKLVEYEAGGVPEYWLFDPIRQISYFYRLNASGKYQPVQPDANGDYTTPILPEFRLHVAHLWRDPLPGYFEIGEIVKAMLIPPEAAKPE
ncbi:MAG: Uma2 family endonuclease [Phototrophicaceae bacterium]|jgi:Uma2 family endonuclease